MQPNPMSLVQEVSAPISSAVVLAQPESQFSLLQAMGREVVTFIIGENQNSITIHRKLIQDNLPALLENKPEHEPILLNIHQDIFARFVQYLYTKQLPVVTSSMNHKKAEICIRDLCMLYGFFDEYEAKHVLLDKVMDNIQDGFLISTTFVKLNACRIIYQSSKPTSLLRKFVVHSIIAMIRNPSYTIDLGLTTTWLNHDFEAMHNFIQAVQNFVPSQDPRVRDKEGKTGCLPCEFHTHANDVVCHLNQV